MGLISRVSSRTYRYFLVRKNQLFSTKNGSTNHLQTTIVLEHQLQPKKKSSKPPAENWPSNTPANKAPLPNAATPVKNCRVLKLIDPSNWLLAELSDELRPFLELTAVLFLLKL